MNTKRRKFSKFIPYDRVQDGIEFEDLIDEDDKTKIIRIFHRRDNIKMFLLEKHVESEKEHLEFVANI